MRQIVLAQRDLDLHAGIGVVAEDLGDARHGLAMRRWLLDQFSDHHLPRLRVAPHVRRHQDILADALVFGNEIVDAAFFIKPPDDFTVGTLEHIDDHTLGTAALVDADLARGGAITVQRLVHFLGR